MQGTVLQSQAELKQSMGEIPTQPIIFVLYIKFISNYVYELSGFN